MKRIPPKTRPGQTKLQSCPKRTHQSSFDDFTVVYQLCPQRRPLDIDINLGYWYYWILTLGIDMKRMLTLDIDVGCQYGYRISDIHLVIHVGVDIGNQYWYRILILGTGWFAWDTVIDVGQWCWYWMLMWILYIDIAIGSW